MPNSADSLYVLSQRLKRAGAGDLRKELAKSLRTAAKPLIAETRKAALAELPQRGGLAQRYSRQKQRVAVKTGPDTAGVSVVLSGQPGITTGIIRHPVFGRNVYVNQQVSGTWWDDTLARNTQPIVSGINDALQAVASKLEARVSGTAP